MKTLGSWNELIFHMDLYGTRITQSLSHVLLENQSCKVKSLKSQQKTLWQSRDPMFQYTRTPVWFFICFILQNHAWTGTLFRPHDTCCIHTEYSWRQLLHSKLLLIGCSHWTKPNKIQWTHARNLHPLRVHWRIRVCQTRTYDICVHTGM